MKYTKLFMIAFSTAFCAMFVVCTVLKNFGVHEQTQEVCKERVIIPQDVIQEVVSDEKLIIEETDIVQKLVAVENDEQEEQESVSDEELVIEETDVVQKLVAVENDEQEEQESVPDEELVIEETDVVQKLVAVENDEQEEQESTPGGELVIEETNIEQKLVAAEDVIQELQEPVAKEPSIKDPIKKTMVPQAVDVVHVEAEEKPVYVAEKNEQNIVHEKEEQEKKEISAQLNIQMCKESVEKKLEELFQAPLCKKGDHKAVFTLSGDQFTYKATVLFWGYDTDIAVTGDMHGAITDWSLYGEFNKKSRDAIALLVKKDSKKIFDFSREVEQQVAPIFDTYGKVQDAVFTHIEHEEKQSIQQVWNNYKLLQANIKNRISMLGKKIDAADAYAKKLPESLGIRAGFQWCKIMPLQLAQAALQACKRSGFCVAGTIADTATQAGVIIKKAFCKEGVCIKQDLESTKVAIENMCLDLGGEVTTVVHDTVACGCAINSITFDMRMVDMLSPDSLSFSLIVKGTRFEGKPGHFVFQLDQPDAKQPFRFIAKLAEYLCKSTKKEVQKKIEAVVLAAHEKINSVQQRARKKIAKAKTISVAM